MSRTIPPSTKKLAPLPPCRPRLVPSPPVGTLRHPVRPQGSNQPLISWVYGSALTVPGDFIGAPEYPSETCFRRPRLTLSQQPSFPEHNRTTASNYFPTQLKTLVSYSPETMQLIHHYHPFTVVLTKFWNADLKPSVCSGEKEDEVSVDRIEAVYYENKPTPAVPPRRGRPRKISTPTQPPKRRVYGRPKKVHQPILNTVQPRRPHLIYQMDHRFLHLGGGL